MNRREQIARIVDAEAFRPGVPAEIRPGMVGSIVADIERRDRALAKADQIMAAEGEAVAELATALHNAVHLITLEIGPDHETAREAMRVLARHDPERPHS